MKTLIPIFVIVLFLISCEKPHCWKCEWDKGFTTPITVCDKTESEIVNYERENSFTTLAGTRVNMNCYSY